MKSLALALLCLCLHVGESFAGIASYNRWNISQINVCFAEKETEYRNDSLMGSKRDWKTSEKKYVENILREEFTSSRTGYSFVGFKDCKKSEKIDVVIGLRRGFTLKALSGELGIATIGMGRTAGASSYESSRGAVVLSPSGFDRNTITHEFGHVLGLDHEHEHPDAKDNAIERCSYYSSQSYFYPDSYYTDFDEKSVMNYCYIDSSRGFDSGLSPHDQELIYRVFKNKY